MILRITPRVSVRDVISVFKKSKNKEVISDRIVILYVYTMILCMQVEK
jgi:hypothetical protein